MVRVTKTLLPALLGAFLLVTGVFGQDYSAHGNLLAPMSIKGVSLMVEVVATPEKQYLGLSHRPGLPPDRGMLFVFPQAQGQVFCMRDMRFAIDIIWITEGRVAGMEQNLSPQDTGAFASPVPVPLVLEVAAGFVQRHGIAVGDPVKLHLPGLTSPGP